MSQKAVAVDFLKLAKIRVQDQHGGEVFLPSFWKDRPAILVFLRHFGCPACRGHAYDVWSRREQYQKNGAKIVFVGNGDQKTIQSFKQDLNILEAPVYVDPTLESFRACGFRRVQNPYTDEAMKKIESYQAKGFSEMDYGDVAGDGHQLGGVIVIRPGNQIAYHYISQIAADYPEFIQES